MIHDLSSDTDETPPWELCVVGTGPVGMSLALEFDRLGHKVLLLESGDREVEPARAEASRAILVDPDRHAPMEIAVCRALGGTSWTWGGRCVAYDDVDWLPRPFVTAADPDATWPIREQDVLPFYPRASTYLLCGSDRFHYPLPQQLTDGLTMDSVERWATESRIILQHRQHILASPHIHLCLNATVTGFDLDKSDSGSDAAQIQCLTVATPGGLRRVRAKRIVLAMGGVETTRLLLHVQKDHPHLFGGSEGALGRFYMGHIAGKIATIQLNRPQQISDLDFQLDDSGSYYRRRFRLSTETQLQHGVLNTAFWPDNPRLGDPNHRSGVLSAVFLALAFPPLGRRLLSEAIRISHVGPPPYRIAAHLRNAILGAPRGARDLARILYDRFVKKPKKPGFLVPNAGGNYALNYHAEHAPCPDSRITVGDQTDSFGVRRAVIDLRFLPIDVESVIHSHKLLDHALRANGLGSLEFQYPERDLPQKIIAQITDGFHQVGTTRMGNNPATSVVDADLKVHGLKNLYLASSSVFPTSSQANSTFLAVALAMRLADHLAGPRDCD